MRRLTAEAIGTALLAATVIGSGIAGEQFSGGSIGLALLINALATGAMLAALILVFGPVSGAQFNPAVTLAFLIKRDLSVKHGAAYAAVQIAAALGGAMLAHLMFDRDLVQTGAQIRSGLSQWTGEFVATFALVLTILACVRNAPGQLAFGAGLVITAGALAASSAFANPALTIARTITSSFTAIRPEDAAPFIAVQCAAAIAALYVARWLSGPSAAIPPAQ